MTSTRMIKCGQEDFFAVPDKWVCAWVCMYSCTYTIHVYIYIGVYMGVYVHIYECMHVYMYMHTLKFALKVDVDTIVAMYFHNLSQYEMSHGRIQGFEDFNRFYCRHEEQNGQIVFLVHTTETNQNRIKCAIDKWTNERISSVSGEKFMANFFMGPKLQEYHKNPLLQEHYPQISYKNILIADPDIY